MKPLLLSFALFVPFALGARYFFVCETLRWCARADLAPGAGVRVAVAMPDGRDRAVTLAPYDVGAVAPPLSRAYDAALDTLADLARGWSPDYALRIEAPLRRGEAAKWRAGHYADLGIARAAALAEALQAREVSAEAMSLHAYPVPAGAPGVPRLSFEAVVPKSLDPGLTSYELLADSMAFLGLRFGRNSTALRPDSAFAAYADALVATLNADTALRLRLVGHTDDRSTAAHNDSLGRWRAEAVATYLTQRGLRTPVVVESRGAREPAADNDTPEGRYRNRRVEAVIE